MQLFLSIRRSIRYGALGALMLTMLVCGPVSAFRWCPPGQPDTSTQCQDINPSGGFDVPILSGGTTTYKHVGQSFSLIMANGYGDSYYLNKLRDRDNYAAYRGYAKYRGFSLSGCSTLGEAVLIRMKGTPAMPEHISLMSTSVRWGNTLYLLNDVVHPLNSTVYVGYENWYPFDMSCSVAMYIVQGGW